MTSTRSGLPADLVSGREEPPSWHRFLAAFAAALILVTGSLYAFILWMDPYGLRTGPGHAPTPIMDLNQRYMYPQIVRSRRYDSGVFGTSTARLLDPQALDQAFGGRFANLAINAGTPWEQMRLADLFLRQVPDPKTLVFGLDRNWCDPDADRPAKRLTFRSFPPWLYDDIRLTDYPELANLRTLMIAGRVALHRLDLMPERIRGDGYEVFTPPESRYDLARARFHIWNGGPPQDLSPVVPPATLDEAARRALAFPAIAWLSEILERVPAGTRTILVFPPVHVAAQARPGTLEAVRDAECKARFVALARRHEAVAVDFRIPSPVTSQDTNYWDNQHYRIGIAPRIVEALRMAAESGREAPGSFDRVLAYPGRS